MHYQSSNLPSKELSSRSATLRLSNGPIEQKGKNTDMLDPMCMWYLSTGNLAKLNCTDT